MWYHASPDGLSAESAPRHPPHGVDWAPLVDGPVLVRGQAWEGIGILNPSVLHDPDATDGFPWKMWYDGGPSGDAGRRIGLAISTDGGRTWTQHEDNPVLLLGGADGSEGMWGPEVVLDEESGVLEMWYFAYSSASSGIAYATSLDGVLWTKHGRISIEGESLMTMHPSVLKDGDQYDVWYTTYVGPSCCTEVVHATAERTLPLALFTAEVDGDQVTLDASRTSPPPGCTIESYEWDFGDGTTGEGVTAEHTYAPGSHMVTLTVRDSCGGTASNQRRIEVRCPAGDLAPWTSVDIGAPRFPGSAARDGDCYQVCAGGAPLAERPTGCTSSSGI